MKKTDRLKPSEAENAPEMKKTGPETFGRDQRIAAKLALHPEENKWPGKN